MRTETQEWLSRVVLFVAIIVGALILALVPLVGCTFDRLILLNVEVQRPAGEAGETQTVTVPSMFGPREADTVIEINQTPEPPLVDTVIEIEQE